MIGVEAVACDGGEKKAAYSLPSRLICVTGMVSGLLTQRACR